MSGELRWVPAIDEYDLAFARALARRTMMPYYTRHGLRWRDADFDEGWRWRENYCLQVGSDAIGFISLSRDARALYVRELHLIEGARRQGHGHAVLQRAFAQARRHSLPAVRLTVFKDNPAQHLYLRAGFARVGEDGCFWRMECPLCSPE